MKNKIKIAALALIIGLPVILLPLFILLMRPVVGGPIVRVELPEQTPYVEKEIPPEPERVVPSPPTELVQPVARRSPRPLPPAPSEVEDNEPKPIDESEFEEIVTPPTRRVDLFDNGGQNDE